VNTSAFRKQVQHFRPSEFPESVEWGDPVLFGRLDAFRGALGCRIFPSPARGGLARFEWADRFSWHYCDREGEIRSRAVDVFCECSAIHAYTQALASQLWGGVGVYFDTRYNQKPWIMFHLDTRQPGDRHAKQTALVWFRDRTGQYHYPQYNRRMEATLLSLLLEATHQRK
jgi:hypothetical protein